MKREIIQNVVDIIPGDVYVDVDIRFMPMSPTDSINEKLCVSKLNSDLGQLAHEIKSYTKDRIKEHFNDPSLEQ